jgi:ABC-type polysaccharide/polyol phosphate transport system ATPase subunit
MRPDDIGTVLDHRLEDIARYQAMFKQLESERMEGWSEGMKFVLGFGKAMSRAMETYINDNRHLLEQDKPVKAATA